MVATALDVRKLATRVIDELERAVIGKRQALELVVLALLADGHVLIEDLPGLAKTSIARSLARVCAIDFARIQFTPDLMPSDITGSSIYARRDEEFRFVPGPIFTNLLLADEVNRAPAKTQAALLEAMQERQVTVDGRTRPLARPFVVLATQNPIEYEGTYPLPEAQLDRFMLRLGIGYPEPDDERRILLARADRPSDDVELARVCDGAALIEAQAAVGRVHVDPSVAGYMVDIVSATRSSPRLDVGASPRGSLALLKLSRARAALLGRDFVVPDDVKAVAVPALAHRVLLASELWVQQVQSADVVADIVDGVEVPVAPADGPR
jgi:MoxR-like ATPase